MSTTVIILVCTAIAAVIGLRVYFEYRHEDDKQLENIDKEEDVFLDLQAFVINPTESTTTPVAVEERVENQPMADTQAPAAVEVEQINSVAAKTESKPKKKRYYYPKKKKAAIKAKSNKQK